MTSTADLVRKVLKDATSQVSDGGHMVFSMRNLFYAVRQLFLTRFYVCPSCGSHVKLLEPPSLFVCKRCKHQVEGGDLRAKYPQAPFYSQYDSFTQGFLRRHEKAHGKIKGMYREERGKYSYPNEHGSTSSVDIGGKETIFTSGVGNKVIMVEKAGVYGVLTENRFDMRLDAVVVSTEGFSIEAARELLAEAEEEGLKVCVLHDYDINGLLIAETLTRPTKRVDVHVSEVVDLGLTWTIVNQLMTDKGLIPEPVDLKLPDVSKLEGMLERGAINEEEHRFLLGRTNELYQAWKNGEKVGVKHALARGFRVELNALRPSELIEWLEQRLEELGLWKTLPTQEELDERMKDRMKEDLEAAKRELVDELSGDVEEKLGLDLIRDALYSVREAVEDAAEEEVATYMEDVEYPTMDLEEFKDRLRRKMTAFWTRLADAIASRLASDLEEPVRSTVEEERETIVQAALEDQDVKEAEASLQSVVKGYLNMRRD